MRSLSATPLDISSTLVPWCGTEIRFEKLFESNVRRIFMYAYANLDFCLGIHAML